MTRKDIKDRKVCSLYSFATHEKNHRFPARIFVFSLHKLRFSRQFFAFFEIFYTTVLQKCKIKKS